MNLNSGLINFSTYVLQFKIVNVENDKDSDCLVTCLLLIKKKRQRNDFWYHLCEILSVLIDCRFSTLKNPFLVVFQFLFKFGKMHYQVRCASVSPQLKEFFGFSAPIFGRKLTEIWDFRTSKSFEIQNSNDAEFFWDGIRKLQFRGLMGLMQLGLF